MKCDTGLVFGIIIKKKKYKKLRKKEIEYSNYSVPVYSCLSLWPTTPQKARPVVTPIDSLLKHNHIYFSTKFLVAGRD